MKCIYTVRTDTLKDEEGNIHTVYGIEAVDSDSGTVLRSVSDVFFDAEVAEAFAASCTRAELSPMHLMDVLEDVLV